MKPLSIVYCRACQTNHAPGDHKMGGTPLSTKATAPAARGKSGTKAGRKPNGTRKTRATATPTNVPSATVITSETAVSAEQAKPKSRKKPFGTIVQAFKKQMTVPEAMEIVTRLARPELEAIAIEYVVDRAKRQKNKAKWQKAWRAKDKARREAA